MIPRVLIAVLLSAGALAGQERLELHRGWLLASSEKVGRDGAKISAPTYRARGWTSVTVPSTVVGALVEAGVYRDPFFGMNMRTLPGMTYPIGANFVHTPMDSTSPFAVPWWYRTTFRVPSAMRRRRIRLNFDGINYRANVWLNGHRLADSSQGVGTYPRYEFGGTDSLAKNGANVLAVEVFAPTPPDLQTTWVDWNPSPPDKDMGLWQPVYLAARGDVVIRYPEVLSRVDTAAKSAELTVATDLRNLAAHAV